MTINKEATNEQAILETAERLFLEKGFAMTSTTEIAKAVGCNQAMVHYYFRTKDKLFEAIFEKKIKMFVGIFLQTDDEKLPFLQKLQLKIERHFDILQENPRIPFLFFNELTTHPERIDNLKQRLQEFPISVFQRLNSELKIEIENGNIRPIETIDLILSILSLNVILFLACPIVKKITGISDDDFQIMLQRRKKENVIMIINSLRPLEILNENSI